MLAVHWLYTGCTLAVHWLYIISALTVTMCVNDPVRIYVILTIQRKAFSTCVCVCARAFTHPLILECLHAHLYGRREGRCRAEVAVCPWDHGIPVNTNSSISHSASSSKYSKLKVHGANGRTAAD